MSKHPAGLASMILRRTRIGNQVSRNDRAILWATMFTPKSVYAVRMVGKHVKRNDRGIKIRLTSFNSDPNAEEEPERGDQCCNDTSLSGVT